MCKLEHCFHIITVHLAQCTNRYDNYIVKSSIVCSLKEPDSESLHETWTWVVINHKFLVPGYNYYIALPQGYVPPSLLTINSWYQTVNYYIALSQGFLSICLHDYTMSICRNKTTELKACICNI